MSTRCTFGTLDKSGKIELFYCHSDGYIEGVGRYLLEHVHSMQDMRKLMAAGHRSFIDPKGAYTDEENHEKPWTFANIQELSQYLHWDTDTEYCYLWDEAAGKLTVSEQHYLAHEPEDNEPWCRWSMFLDLAERNSGHDKEVRLLPAWLPQKPYFFRLTPLVPAEKDEETGEQIYKPDYERVQHSQGTYSRQALVIEVGQIRLKRKPKHEPWLLEVGYITERGDEGEDTLHTETNMPVRWM